MPITLRKTTKIIIIDSFNRNNFGKKEQPQKNFAQKVKIETKSNTIKVLR